MIYLLLKLLDVYKRQVHSSAALTIVMSIVLTIVGILGTNPMLHAVGIPADVFQESSTYLAIYFAGISFNLIYNLSLIHI